MMMGMAQVVFLKKRKSSGNFQGSSPFTPMTLFSEAATMCDKMLMAIIFLVKKSNGDRRFYSRMVLIIL